MFWDSLRQIPWHSTRILIKRVIVLPCHVIGILRFLQRWHHIPLLLMMEMR